MIRPSFTQPINIPVTSFPQTVNVARAVQTTLPSGGRTVTTPQESPVIYANVQVSIQEQGASEKTVNGRLMAVLDHNVYTKTPMALMNGDFILFGSRVLIVQTFRNVSELGVVYLIKAIEYMTQPIA